MQPAGLLACSLSTKHLLCHAAIKFERGKKTQVMPLPLGIGKLSGPFPRVFRAALQSMLIDASNNLHQRCKPGAFPH
jgi:hypothetical protein